MRESAKVETGLWETLEARLPPRASLVPGDGCTESVAAVPDRIWARAVVGPLREFLRRPGKGFRGAIVRGAWRSTRPGTEPPPALPAIVELIHAGSLVVDDIQDDSSHRRGRPSLHRLIGAPLAMNCGSSLFFWPFELVGELDLPPERELALVRRLTRAMLRCHHGQALDLEARIDELSAEETPAVVAAAAELKTGALLELAAALGAFAAGADEALVGAWERFGCRLGVGLQMLNDLANLHGCSEPAKRHEDLRCGRPTWPWAWLAEIATPSDFAVMQAWQRDALVGSRSPSALAERLRRKVESHGRIVARAYLATAVADLADELGDSPALAEIGAEISRLEAAYAG
ncbi:MAG TPA: polyprenyl synthetase family protein [Planctomycetia bacterium]|nr:polyprenyl synthetase family protein [Planctomycetia bacterium]